MPLYEYRCNKCGGKVTLLIGMTSDRPRRVCPRCGSHKLSKLISRIAPIGHGEEFDELGADDFEGNEGMDDEYTDDMDDEF